MSEPVQEVKKAPITFYEWPGGRKSVAGGTRTVIKLDRPWQSDIVVSKETCPFCTKPQKDVRVVDLGDGGSWRVIENVFTPYPFHRLVIPSECWSKEDIRNLGGRSKIYGALSLAMEEVVAKPDDGIAAVITTSRVLDSPSRTSSSLKASVKLTRGSRLEAPRGRPP